MHRGLYKAVFSIATLFATLFATSCIKEPYTGPKPGLPSRTVLAYLGGDNSLSSTLNKQVEELLKGWTYTGNRCLIYIDPVDDVPRLLSLRGGCQVNPTPYIDTLAVYEEENSASAEVFARVWNDVKQLHPADSYGLIFSSHASGWLPEKTLSNPNRSLGSDVHTGTMGEKAEMELADFASVIPDGQFDFIIFEACLMSGVEVAYELRNKTDYILASSAELLIPGFVPIYNNSLWLLFNTEYTVEQSLVSFAQAYYNYTNMQSGAYCSTTLSVLKTKNIDALATFSRGVFANNPFETIADLSVLQHFDRPGSYGDLPISPRYFDFAQCMELVATPAQYAEFENILNDIVVGKASTPTFMTGYNGFKIQHHCGLTTYIQQPGFTKLNEAYCQTAWWKATH